MLDQIIAVPGAWSLEVGNALTALFRRHKLGIEQAQEALKSFHQIPVRLADVGVAAAVEIGWKHRIYAYDSYMLQCAQRYHTPLLSLDTPQCEVARALGIEVIEV
ncbi:MAG: type II toxin-antitoxin system VapC family toxin [Gemmatimonadetes bacterium]|nr:type II toxin-antitoxin system VapC family toxin [Gemmatimonadota bacterium]